MGGSAVDVEGLVRPIVESAGLEFVDVAFHREEDRRVLRVTVDREGGVDLDTISEISERVSRRLDIEGFDPGPYSLEVSSPGVERPLREPRDFGRRVGELVKVRTARPVEGSRTLTGRIVEAGPERLRIVGEPGSDPGAEGARAGEGHPVRHDPFWARGGAGRRVQVLEAPAGPRAGRSHDGSPRDARSRER
ncbi:MAG: ribosome maturation factor RimP [Actinobacteria bacterium]|nr:MAG: ribosome maturation factor RimP [Actinomycetota bacterium]